MGGCNLNQCFLIEEIWGPCEGRVAINGYAMLFAKVKERRAALVLLPLLVAGLSGSGG